MNKAATGTLDPVSGMEVDPATAVVVDCRGQRSCFCEGACAETFREDPQRWVPAPSGRA